MINGTYFAEIGRGLERLAIAAFDALFEYRELRRERRQLAALDERLLRDIGLSRADVERECRRPLRRRRLAGYSASAASGVLSAPEGSA
jgi:uncharacterized protein YjiS (DUF1127 family)